MPTDLPSDYKPEPAPGPDSPKPPGRPGISPNPPGQDNPSPGAEPPIGPDVVSPVPAGVPAPPQR